MLPDEKLEELRVTLQSLCGKRCKTTLNHGDLRLKNVLVNEKARIVAILDWENCTSNIAPQWELSLALHDLSVDEKENFLQGYGIAPARLCSIAPALKALNIVNYAPEIERRAGGKDSNHLRWLHARLSGALDLYST